MNKRQRAQAAREWNKRLTAIEKRYVVRIFNSLRNQIKGVVTDIEVYGVEYARRRVSSLGFNEQMTMTIRDMHRNIGVAEARRALAALNREPVVKKSEAGEYQEKATLGFAAEWIEMILEYFRLHLLESVTTISNTTRDWINRKLDEGTSQGYGTNEIIKLINDREYMGYRAELIVRTEGTRAANYGISIGADKYEYEMIKEWISIPDNRRRHSHRLVDGQQRELNERFSNGLLYPGDPEGPIKELANCRCVQGISAKRDDKGRLIPKTRASVILPGSLPSRQTITI